MIRTTLNWTIKNLKVMHDEKQTLNFDHPIQRQSCQWTNEQQSLLIHSMLAGYPIPAVYMEKRNTFEVDAKGKHTYSYAVLDGKQRMTTSFAFINGEFALSEDLPVVTIEGTDYEIAGKYFSDLADDVQQEILRFRFTITCFEDVTADEIEEIFFRLNNSTPLTKAQKSKPLMGVENSIFVNEILSGRFFTEKCSFSAMQLKKSDDMCTLLQTMMLLDNKYRGYEYSSISADEVMRYSQSIKNNYPPDCKDRLLKIIGFLNNAFYTKDRNLKKINIPIVFLLADIALERGITNIKFRRFITNFFEEHKEEYGAYCSSGSIKKEKVLGRLQVMSYWFDDYFKPEEVVETMESNDSAKPVEAMGPVDSDEADANVEESTEDANTDESMDSSVAEDELVTDDMDSNEDAAASIESDEIITEENHSETSDMGNDLPTDDNSETGTIIGFYNTLAAPLQKLQLV